MEMNVFEDKTLAATSAYFGPGYDVSLTDVRKLGGLVRRGLVIRKKDEAVAPTIYLDDFLRMVNEGAAFSDIVNDIVSVAEGARIPEFDPDFFADFEKVRNRIIMRLVPEGVNRTLLNEVPYFLWNDLAVVFYCQLPETVMEDAGILIRNEHLKMWDISADYLSENAGLNMPRISKAVIIPMASILLECGAGQFDPELTEKCPMYILTNEKRLYGASALVWSDKIAELSRSLGKDLFILPSSVHEVILLPDTGDEDPECLKEMIHEVNITQVSPEDRLSDELYYFDRETGKVEIWGNR